VTFQLFEYQFNFPSRSVQACDSAEEEELEVSEIKEQDAALEPL